MADATKVGSIYYDVSLDNKPFNKASEQVKTQLSGLKGSFNGLSPGIKAVGVAIAGVFTTKLIVDFFRSSIEAANESNRMMAQTEATIRSTGGAAGMTAQQVNQLAKAIQANTAISDEAAQAGINMLLTYTRIGGSVIPQATQAVMDMATAMGGGMTPIAEALTDTAKQLGFALNNPLDGMTRLRRMGISFTYTQEQLIKKFMATNQVGKAQQVMLDELANKFGGSAAAQAQTFEGRMQSLGNTVDDVKEEIGRALIPALTNLMDAFSPAGGGANALVIIIKALSSVMISATLIAQALGMTIGAVFGLIYGTIRYGIGNGVETFKKGMNDMYMKTVDTSKALNSVWGDSSKDQTNAFKNGLNQQVDAGSSAKSKIEKQLRDETETFKEENTKRTKSFQQNLQDMIFAHLDKVKQIRDDLADENKSFDESMADQKKSFADTMASMSKDHEDTIAGIKDDIASLNQDTADANQQRKDDALEEITTEKTTYDQKSTDLQTQLNTEIAKGKNASGTKIRILQAQLAQEKTDYQAKVDSINAKVDLEVQKALDATAKKQADLEAKMAQENLDYANQQAIATERDNTETARIAATHAQRTAELNTTLATETGILTAHQGEVDAVKDKAREDDITRLTREYNEENAAALVQHNKKMIDIAVNGTSEGGAYTGALNDSMTTGMDTVKTTIDTATKDAANTMVKNLGEGAKQAGKDMIKNFVNSLKGFAMDVINAPGKFTGWAINPLLQSIQELKNLPTLANGTTAFGGGLALVGERGPELVNLPPGTDVLSNDKTQNAVGGTQNNNIHIDRIQNESDIQSMVRELGFRMNLIPK
jgi:hypothetical protein